MAGCQKTTDEHHLEEKEYTWSNKSIGNSFPLLNLNPSFNPNYSKNKEIFLVDLVAFCPIGEAQFMQIKWWECGVGQRKWIKMKKKKLAEWVIIILIILFFAIPVCSLALNESVTQWPFCSTHFVYNFLFK